MRALVGTAWLGWALALSLVGCGQPSQPEPAARTGAGEASSERTEPAGSDPRDAPTATAATGAAPAVDAADPADGAAAPPELADALRQQVGKGLTTPLSATDYSDDPDFKVPENLPRYAGAHAVTGSIRFSGSSTVSVLLMTWLRAYEDLQPDVKIEISGGSSSAAMPALLDGSADVGMLSRKLLPEEVERFRSRFGHEPTEIRAGTDAIAIFVNRRNPLPSLTIDQVERIFGRDPEGALPIEEWGELGLGAEWTQRAVTVVGPRPGLGSYDVFRALVLRGRPYRTSMDLQVVDHSIVNAVGADVGTVGFCSRFLATRRTRIVPLAPRPDAPPVLPTRIACLTGTYPLSRPMTFVINIPPGGQPSAAVQDFIRYAMSYEGQQATAARGDFPVSREMVVEAYAAIGIPLAAPGLDAGREAVPPTVR